MVTYLILIVNDERTSLLDASAIPHLAFASPKAFGLVHLLDISPGLNLLQEDMGLLGLVVGLNLV